MGKIQFTLFLYLLTFSLRAQQEVYIKAGKMVDVETNTILDNQIIQLSGNKITKISSKITIPENAEIIDLSEYTVMPGLIDAHTHLFYSEPPTEEMTANTLKTIIIEGEALRTLRAAARGKTWLEAGFTSIKDLGNSGQHLDWALKLAEEEGTVVCPRIFASGPIISSEGGQFYGLQYRHKHIAELEYRIVKGVEDAINAVRENVNYGADVIKICADNAPNNTSLTVKEMEAIVKTAHRYGLKVTAHTVSEQSAWEAIQCGVDGIEHGYTLTDTTLMLMAKKGVYFVPTDCSRALNILYMQLINYKEDDLDQRVDEYLKRQHERFQKAMKYGVKIVAGSDSYIDYGLPQGETAIETLVAYHEAGMKPLDIIKSATLTSAEFMNMLPYLGSIKEGRLADIVALKGDIIDDFPNAIRNISFVMKDGIIYKNE